MWAKQNWRWLAVGMTVVIGLYVLGAGTFFLVARTLWPYGPPMAIERIAYTSPQVTAGARTTMQATLRKERQCWATPALVFIDANDRQESFLFSEWPSVETGESSKTVNFYTRVPDMAPGTYRYQLMISFACPDGGYTVPSRLEEVEIVARGE